MLKKIILLITIDQITKVLIGSRDFFFGPLKIALVKNHSLPFTTNADVTVAGKWTMIIIVVCFFLLTIFALEQRQKMSKQDVLGYSFIFAGAISNIIDRLFLGYVRDHFDLSLGFVFNFADIFIVVGLILLVIKLPHFGAAKQS